MTEHDDDVLTSRLRDSLRAEADTVVPRGDGLMRIREGVAGRRSRIWWRAPSTALAAAAVVGIAIGGSFVLNRGGDDGHQVANPTTTVPTPTPSTTTSLPAPTASTSPPAGKAYDKVPVYYVQPDGSLGKKLYREFHDGVRSSGEVSQAALEQVLAAKPADPDYSSLWAGARLDDYTLDGGVATVRLSGTKPSAVDLHTGLQEIVYTITAAVQDPSVTVTLYVNGVAVEGTDTKPATRAVPLEVQGLIWILSPTEGQALTSPIRLHFFGTGFEGQFEYDIRQGTRTVRQGIVAGGEMGKLKDMYADVTLPPGTYELRAYDSGGSGIPSHFDTKTFTVR